MNFVLTEARVPRRPVIVEVPHAGLFVDAGCLATLIAPARALGQDADLFVDELYEDAPDLGAPLLVSQVSRYVCDLNRSEDDVDALAAEGGQALSSPHGMIWRATTGDRPALACPLPRAELNRRRSELYRPYHRKLSDLIEETERQFGFAILLCAHSMPSFERGGAGDPASARADVVPGSRGGTTCNPAVLAAVEQTAKRAGLSLKHDQPYRGGFSTARYGNPSQGVFAIQIELARRLYMDEGTLTRLEQGFKETRAFCRDLVATLGALELPQTR